MQIASTRLAAINNHRFPGQYYDAETGLHQNYFRDYEASIGRYVQRDPIGLDGGINVYLYSYQNSISYFDPDGLRVMGQPGRPDNRGPGRNKGPPSSFGGIEVVFIYGGGFTSVTCCNEQDQRIEMNFVKACIGPSLGYGASFEGVSGFSGKRCSPENYEGLFLEINLGPVSIDIGLNSGGLSGTDEMGVGAGWGGGLATCWYTLIAGPKVIGDCCNGQ
jgi:RHS repeat-associated protein